MKKLLLTLSMFLMFSNIFASVPKLIAHINDYANLMSEEDKRQAEKYLTSLEVTTGGQIAVLTVQSLEGDDITSYAYNVASAWELGQKDKDNGVLLLVALDERKVRIEVGYGFEGDLTDAKCGLIIRNVILPEFRKGDYSKGILQGVINICGILDNDESIVAESVSHPKTSKNDPWPAIFIMIAMICIIIFSVRDNIKHPERHRSTVIIAPTISSFSRSDHSSFSSEGFSGGGGHFGGGGASGGW